MLLDYRKVISFCNQSWTILASYPEDIAFKKFKILWNSIENIDLIFKDTIFHEQVIVFNIKIYNNILVHNFLMNKAKEILKENYSNFVENINDSIFKGAIELGDINNIEKYIPSDFNKERLEESLKNSIKSGAWVSFEWFLNNKIDPKSHSKFINWAAKEFWNEAQDGYTFVDFIKNVITHHLYIQKSIKKPIYNLIKPYSFEFINELIKDEKCIVLLKDIKVEIFYKLLFKEISKKGLDLYYYNLGLDLLKNSYQLIPYHFSNLKFNSNFLEENPQIHNIIENFILKEKLDLLPDLPNNLLSTHKKLKI